MIYLPKAIRDLQGDLWVPNELACLLERMLRDAAKSDDAEYRKHLATLQELLGFTGNEPLKSPREQLGLPDPVREQIAQNLLKH